MGAVKVNTSGASKSSRQVSRDLQSYGGQIRERSAPQAGTYTMRQGYLGSQEEAVEIVSETFLSQPLWSVLMKRNLISVIKQMIGG